jgi:hypothetical protein
LTKTKLRMFALASTVVVLSLAAGRASVAGPIVTETVSGTSGNYTLDFTIQNNLGNTNDIYFFGVLIDSGRSITGSPGDYNPNVWTTWNNAIFGGSNINYNNNWVDLTFSNLPNGSTLGGFEVTTTDAVAPTSVNWFAYASGGTYNGDDNFNTSTNPGFEGVVTATPAVPEPSTLVMAGIASVIGLGYQARRRRGRVLATTAAV